MSTRVSCVRCHRPEARCVRALHVLQPDARGALRLATQWDRVVIGSAESVRPRDRVAVACWSLRAAPMLHR